MKCLLHVLFVIAKTQNRKLAKGKWVKRVKSHYLQQKNIKCQIAILMLGKGVMKCMREFVCLLLQQIEGEVEGG